MEQHPPLSLELPSVNVNASDLHGRERLAMPIQLLVLLLALEVEDQDLVGAALPEHLPGHEGLGRLAQFAFRAADRQHLVELHVFAVSLRQLLNFDYVAGCDAILLSPGADDRLHSNASKGCVSHVAADSPKLIVRLHFPSQNGNLHGPSDPAPTHSLRAWLWGVPDGSW